MGFWRRYRDSVNSAVVAALCPREPVSRCLKTDAFEECPGAGVVSGFVARLLAERGVKVVAVSSSRGDPPPRVPHFVSNCGGVLGGTMEFACIEPGRIETFIERRIGERTAGIPREAARRDLAPSEWLTPLTLARSRRIRDASERRRLFPLLFRVGLELHRRRLLPESFVACLAPPYFHRLLDGGPGESD